MSYDVVIVGGGPAGLSAALILGRARKRAVLFDAGVPRNAQAREVHSFVTRDGTPPSEFRRIAREQLKAYPSVAVRNARVDAIRGTRGEFEVEVDGEIVHARRIILGVGVIDELPDMPGYRELWGRSVFQCPYCHGWEVRDRAFGYLAPSATWLEWGIFLRGWTGDVRVFTDGKYEVSPEVRERLDQARVCVEERPIKRLVAAHDDAGGAHLESLELEDGTLIPRDVLFVRPAQKQTELVSRLGLELDEQGFVRTNDKKETSTPGIYAAGDLTTSAQAALAGAQAGVQAASMLNHELTIELAMSGVV
jgi:thioredoxin reductase